MLDLDNTIWGGVIGDDLLDGIVLGHGSAAGEAFLAVQRMALALRRRGVLIAVCSKNDEHVAREPFRSHPDMLLREEHIAAFVANWDDKPANLQLIARTLDIGIESLVFVDDNPVEREQVRQRLPQVAVPELPADPALFPAMISAGGYFEATSFTPDDRERAARYSAGAARAAAAARYGDVDDFLASLDTTIAFAPFDPVGRSRITQLILRSNQFNLTTQRYSEADVAQWETNPAAFTRQVRLMDRFGDNGVISVVICRRSDPSWTIDTWLMSCRVLNRRVEEAVLDEIVAAARAAGASSLLGVFRPTDRNGIVKQHYAKLGFALVARDNESERWQLDVTSYQPKRPPMRILSQ